MTNQSGSPLPKSDERKRKMETVSSLCLSSLIKVELQLVCSDWVTAPYSPHSGPIEREPAGGLSEQARRALEPFGRALEPAMRIVEPSGRALEPTGIPGARWAGQLRGWGGGEEKRKRTKHSWYAVVP